jgi:membrane-associated phospholipid phosphatase
MASHVARAETLAGQRRVVSDASFLGPVPRKQIRIVLILALIYSLVFDVFYGGASLLAPYVPWRVRVDFPFEARIPFVPEAALVYLSVLPMLLLAPFVLRDLRDYTALVIALIVETLVGFVGFMLLPVEPSELDRVLPATDSVLYTFADWLNLEGNYLPSLHVAFAVTALLAYLEHARGIGKGLLVAWTCAIAVSTLLIHQHYILDVITGAGLAWVCWRVAVGWAHRRVHMRAISG